MRVVKSGAWRVELMVELMAALMVVHLVDKKVATMAGQLAVLKAALKVYG
jgi:hypothetical protein